jgi:hypothetical protein
MKLIKLSLIFIAVLLGVILILFSCIPVGTAPIKPAESVPNKLVVPIRIKNPGPVDPLNPTDKDLRCLLEPIIPQIEPLHPPPSYCLEHPYGDKCKDYSYTFQNYKNLNIIWRNFTTSKSQNAWVLEINNTSDNTVDLMNYVFSTQKNNYFQLPYQKLNKGQEIKMYWYGSPSDKLDLYKLTNPIGQ